MQKLNTEKTAAHIVAAAQFHAADAGIPAESDPAVINGEVVKLAGLPAAHGYAVWNGAAFTALAARQVQRAAQTRLVIAYPA